MMEDRLLGIPRHRWKDNIKMDLKGTECEVSTGYSWLRIWPSAGVL
jgi:hypothetical protein